MQSPEKYRVSSENNHLIYGIRRPRIIVRIATGYGLDWPGIESPWGSRFSAPVQTGPGAHPPSCTTGTMSFPGVKSGWGVTLTPNPLLVLWSRKGRVIPLLPVWAVRPVQSLSACTRVHFTVFTFFIRHSTTPCSFHSYTALKFKHIINYRRQLLQYLTLRRLMSYIYMEHPFLVFLDHTQRRNTVGRTPLDE